jgi:hypothetical protein
MPWLNNPVSEIRSISVRGLVRQVNEVGEQVAGSRADADGFPPKRQAALGGAQLELTKPDNPQGKVPTPCARLVV